MKHHNSSRHSIQFRIMALTLAFTVGIAVVVTISNMYNVYQRTRRATLQSIEYSMQVAASNLAQNVAEIDSLADWCTLDSTVRAYVFHTDSTAGSVRNIYNAFSNKYSSTHTARYIQRFLVTDCVSRVMQLGNFVTLSRRLTNTAMADFPGLAAGSPDTAWEQIYADPLVLFAGADGIPITRTITNGRATAKAYLSVSVSLITDCLRGIIPADSGQLCWMMNGIVYRVEDGRLVSLGTPESLGYTASPDAADRLDEKTVMLRRDARTEDGETGPVTLVAYPVGGHDLYVAQTLPDSAVMAQSPMPQTSILIVVSLILLMGVALVLMLRRSITLPIRALQRQMLLISDGNFTTDPAIEWDNEFGDVGRGVNQLSRSVTALMEKRLEDEKQKQDLEYRMLQNQINPHFLYNTLNSIKWMATIQHAPGIAEMTTALSRLLKSVSKGNERLVPLTDEFALLNDYFTIQQYRYGGTITMDVVYIEDESLCRRCQIPRFTLQPLVENAIFHGIEPKSCAGSIAITVQLDQSTGDLLIELADDGVGMTQEQIAKALTEPSSEEAAAKYRHVGMWNVHRRIQYSFGEKYGLSIASVPGTGTTVTVRLPGPEAQPSDPPPADPQQKEEPIV